MTTHAANAAAFLSNEKRAAWHDQTLWLVRQKRDAAARAVPEWEQLRQRASEIKEHVLANLDALVEQFAAAAAANGVTVIRAADAAAFNAAVLEIIRRHGAKNVIKSKSMLTEECGLNHFLADAGVDIVDSDLGERIIQLRRETPSHIVLPAIHLTKEEIGELFHEKLGSPKGLTDPTQLTRIARAHLREKFLAADVALTGVNFGVAESGACVVCTNEGNADMGVHSAPVQVHCMGIEKLVPRWADLGVFTRLLARNATGQPVTTYTSHYAAPKRAAGAAMYVILVDNGRRARRDNPERAATLKCIRCGGCMNTCPVYRRSGGHSYGYLIPGPIGTILAPCADRARYSQLPLASTLCGSCANVCPVKIDIHGQIYDLRQTADAPLWKRLAMRAGNTLFTHPALYNTAGAAARAAVRHLPRPFLYNAFNVWGRSRELPAPPAESFRQWYAKNRKGEQGAGSGERGDSAAGGLSSCSGAVHSTTGSTAGSTATGSAAPLPTLSAFTTALAKTNAAVIAAPDRATALALLAGATAAAGTTDTAAITDFTDEKTAARFSADTPRSELAALDTVVLPGRLGVAENAAIWLDDRDLPHRLLPFIARHLVLLIDAGSVVPTMADAYAALPPARSFGVFISGPSKTADIEQHLVYGAHGAIELTVLLIGTTAAGASS
ncbi:MAG: LUD domain-containing protein [Puniceicoccales bacterium]|jgi:L-lactate dehydrogenase complex protein LldF|nr:LUD domain-containing protein [Puniceicoccales bacterium]